MRLVLFTSLLLLLPAAFNSEATDASSALTEAAAGWGAIIPGTIISTWLNNTNPCDPIWRGLKCDAGNLGTLVVTGINLDYLEIQGHLPPSWGKWLTDLRELHMANNRFTGPLPEEWAGLILLDSLNLKNNALSHSIPPLWSQLTYLVSIDLSHNYLTGTLPPVWDLDANSLDFSHNQLSGTVPSSYVNIRLEALYVTGNDAMCGDVDPALEGILLMDGTHLDEPCPNPPSYRDRPPPGAPRDAISDALIAAKGEMGNPPHLDSWDLNIDHCAWKYIECDGPKISFKTDTVTGLTGPLPASLANAATEDAYLTHIDLSYNALSGSIPPQWSRLANLETLVLDTNLVNGALPAQFSVLNKLTKLSANDNKIRGSVPEKWLEVGALSSLRILAVCNNVMSGKLPPFNAPKALNYISMCNNSFTGVLPPSWSVLRRLNTINLEGNDLEGILPPSWSTMIILHELTLADNALMGSIPDPQWPKGMSALSHMSVDGNTNLCGFIPAAFENVTITDTNSGLRNGPCIPFSPDLNAPLASPPPPPRPPSPPSPQANVPPAPPGHDVESLILLVSRSQWADGIHNLGDWNIDTDKCTWNGVTCNAKSRVQAVHIIDINLGPGPIPDSWSSLTDLNSIMLQATGLSGHLPPSWSLLTQLEELALGPNSIQEGLPKEWETLTRLTSLGIGGNRLSGTYPAQWSKLKSLRYLSVHDNPELVGAWPAWPAGIGSLQVLKMNMCDFRGELPGQWAAYSKLEMLYVGDNKDTSGSLPEAWHLLNGLMVLDISGNPKLTGNIPASWVQMDKLTALTLTSTLQICGQEPFWKHPVTVKAENTALGQACPQPQGLNPPGTFPPARPLPSQAASVGSSPPPSGGVDNGKPGGDNGSGSSGLSGGAIAGIVIGVLVAFALLACLIYVLVSKRSHDSKRKEDYKPSTRQINSGLYPEPHNADSASEVFSAPAPGGGAGMHSRGSRSRSVGSAVSNLVTSMLTASSTDAGPPKVPLSHQGTAV